MQGLLTQAEIGSYISCDPNTGESSTSLFGLDESQIFDKNPISQVRTTDCMKVCTCSYYMYGFPFYFKDMGSIEQKLVPEIESRLKEQCSSLADHFNDITSSKVKGKLMGVINVIDKRHE